MSSEDARYRSRKTGAFAGATLEDGGVCIDVEKMLARSSPRVQQFLNGMSDGARRKFLDGVRRRLTKEGALFLLRHDSGQLLIAHLVTGTQTRPINGP